MKRQREIIKPKLKTKIVIVPWFSKSEWLEVRAKLFSQDLSEMQWAVEQLAIWRCRHSMNIPKPVEATEYLIRARIEDIQFHNQGAIPFSDAGIAMNYSTAIMRFMAMVQRIKHERDEGSDFSDALRALGIPDWMTKIRNDAAHYQLPSTQLLRKAGQIALDWLQSSYWDGQEEIMEDVIAEPQKVVCLPESPTEDIKVLIVKYQQFKYENMTSLKYGTSKEQRLSSLRLNKALIALRIAFNKEITGFIEVLVKPGYLIPRHDHLDALLPENERNFTNSESVILPKAIRQFWLPIIDLFKTSSSFQTLLESLVIENIENDPTSQRISSAWVLALLEEFSRSRQVDWFNLMETVLKQPHAYTPPLLTYILTQEALDFDASIKKSIFGLVQILLCSFNTEESSSKLKKKRNNVSSRIFTVDDLKAEFCEVEGLDLAAGPWKLASSLIKWSEVPIGVLPEEFAPFEVDDDYNERTIHSSFDPVEECEMLEQYASDESEDDKSIKNECPSEGSTVKFDFLHINGDSLMLL